MGLFERLFGKKDKAKVAEQEAATTEVLSEDITSKDTIESEKEALSDTYAHAVVADVVSRTDDISKQAEFSDKAASEQAEGLDPAARGAFLLEREPELELAATDDKTLDQAGESLSQHEAMGRLSMIGLSQSIVTRAQTHQQKIRSRQMLSIK
ncbi:hypothetical protein [Streptococcus equi]|uniref:hypothetical protein n=1 Tax=Streptococcus equi TaxID=1336 RepID=UPI001E630323|nr:hypothetical protein [Streptococcus equi]